MACATMTYSGSQLEESVGPRREHKFLRQAVVHQNAKPVAQKLREATAEQQRIQRSLDHHTAEKAKLERLDEDLAKTKSKVKEKFITTKQTQLTIL